MPDIQRICIGCQKTFNSSNLIKLKVFENKIIINPQLYLDGRSSYLCYNIECMNKAKKSKKLEKSFKGKVKVTEEVWELLKLVLDKLSVAQSLTDKIEGN